MSSHSHNINTKQTLDIQNKKKQKKFGGKFQVLKFSIIQLRSLHLNSLQ